MLKRLVYMQASTLWGSDQRSERITAGRTPVSATCIYTPYDGGEVGSYLGFDESFVEGRVRS